MTLLDELSGYEFEDVVEDVFRNLGYENVRQARRTADEGRDILMEETVNGRRRAVVVECKHTDSVGRPVVQKLHSAVATYDYDGPKRGMVVTTGRFTGPAEDYAERLRENGDPHPIDLLDGADIRRIGDEIGLDLYNGRIEILCDHTLRPSDPAQGVGATVTEQFRGVENIRTEDVPQPESRVTFRPFVRLRAHVDATFETSVGVVHSVDEHNTLVLRADRDGPVIPGSDVRELVASNFDRAIEFDGDQFAATFDDVTVDRFGQTETEYREWAVERLRDAHTTTVHYTGDNNVDYSRRCEPDRSDVSVRSITPVYAPQIRSVTDLGGYSYPLEYYAAGPSRVVTENGIQRCVQCGETNGSTYTYCANCDSINCTSHTKTERLTGDPVCTGCAVTERFFLRRKYFYDEDNLAAFREEYEAMAFHEKAMENRPLVAGTVLVGLFLVVLVALGLVGAGVV